MWRAHLVLLAPLNENNGNGAEPLIYSKFSDFIEMR
jgi:hypothetical protein